MRYTRVASPTMAARRQRSKVVMTQKLFEKICERIANGELLRYILQEKGMPTHSQFHRFREADPERRAAYVTARQHQTWYWADEVVEISDDGRRDYKEFTDKKGQPKIVLDIDHVSRSRLRVDTRITLMKMLNAKDFSGKHKDEDDEPSSFTDLMKKANE